MTSVRLTCSLALLLPLASCTTAPAPSASAPTAVAAAAPPKLLLISIDGLRADALDRGLTPNLQRLIDGGVRARWMTPSYPSLTFPNHYTIVTGLRPDHHGIVNNSMDDAALGRFELSNRDAVTTSGWWGGEPIGSAPRRSACVPPPPLGRAANQRSAGCAPASGACTTARSRWSSAPASCWTGWHSPTPMHRG